MKKNLLNYDYERLKNFILSIDEKPYRAQQLLKWIHFYGCNDFSQMTNLSKGLREKLSLVSEITLPEIIYAKKADDGTFKWLLRLKDGNCIETVFIPEKTRGTLCISSQVGCILNCDFCSTGKQGFNRNLTTGEIISQLWIAIRKLSHLNGQHDHTITNVVLMGMGEPLLNYDEVLPALRLMLDDYAYGLSKYRVTVSTAGIIPGINALSQELKVALALSLHAPNDQLRNQLIPLNKKYPLKELMQACSNYFKDEKKRFITIEYVMLKDINDQAQHVKELIQLLKGIRVKINLIPFNPFPHTAYQTSTLTTIHSFRNALLKAGIFTSIRKTRGEDIDAACGQLIGKVNDRTTRQIKWLNRHKLDKLPANFSG